MYVIWSEDARAKYFFREAGSGETWTICKQKSIDRCLFIALSFEWPRKILSFFSCIYIHAIPFHSRAISWPQYPACIFSFLYIHKKPTITDRPAVGGSNVKAKGQKQENSQCKSKQSHVSWHFAVNLPFFLYFISLIWRN